MQGTLYAIRLSHPSHAARLMMERKGIDHEVKYLPAGLHPLLLRAAGFSRGTTPALKLDGRRIQGSRAIAAALDEFQARPALFPANADVRGAVQQAEEWGEREFQPLPRRFLRWGSRNLQSFRRWMLADVERVPAPRVQARLAMPATIYFARLSGVSDQAVQADLQRLPSLLEKVEQLMEAGTLGGPEPNAADYQIGTTLRLLLAFDDLRSAVEERPAGELGMRVFPDFRYRVPPFLPQPWLRPL